MRPLSLALTLCLGLGAFAQTIPQPISPLACLRKAALDLTRAAPSAADIAALQGGQKTYAALAAGYVASAAFQQFVFNVYRTLFKPTDQTSGDVEEPARIALNLFQTDSDFRGFVNARFTVDPAGQRQLLTTGAGVLTTQNFISSFNGLIGRAWAGNVLHTMADVQLTPVTSVPPGTDTSRSGLAAIPACAVCHVHPVYGVDYVAAFRDCYDVKGLPKAGCAPTTTHFLGKPGATMQDLGDILAGSVEWRSSVIRLWSTQLLARAPGKNEVPLFYRLDGAFVSSGYKLRALVQAIVESPEYCQR